MKIDIFESNDSANVDLIFELMKELVNRSGRNTRTEKDWDSLVTRFKAHELFFCEVFVPGFNLTLDYAYEKHNSNTDLEDYLSRFDMPLCNMVINRGLFWSHELPKKLFMFGRSKDVIKRGILDLANNVCCYPIKDKKLTSDKLLSLGNTIFDYHTSFCSSDVVLFELSKII